MALKFFLLRAITLLPLLCAVGAHAREGHEQRRIDFLLNSVETSNGIVFIRNGSEHDGAAASKHLRQKLDYAGDRVKTAEEFVRYCASESSLTHRKYKVRLPDGTTLDAVFYFTEKLRQFDEKH